MSPTGVQIAPDPNASVNVARLEFDYIERFGVYSRLHFEDRSYTNIQELQYAGSVARLLKERGASPGDRILVMLPNSSELTALMQAIWTIGAVVIPVIPQWTAEEISHVIHHSGPSIAVTAPPLAEHLHQAVDRVSTVRQLLVFGQTGVPGAEDIGPSISDNGPIEHPIHRSSSDMALLLYTSGTTGRPKGVTMTHGNMSAAIASASQFYQHFPPGPMLQMLPLTHVFGLIMQQMANHWGHATVLLRQFEPVRVFEAIERHRVGYTSGVPTMLVYLLHHPARSRHQLSTLDRVISGGAALPEQVRLDFENTFDCRVQQGYGLSESFAIATGYDGQTPYRPGSAGQPAPGLEIRIDDYKNQPLPARKVGEICLRGANITPGYWQDPSATVAAISGEWFRTGDVGYLDEDGFLFITDRKKDLIIKGGENISPGEIEDVIYMHPAVAEVAVIGVPDDLFGEEIWAVVQTKPGQEVAGEEIQRHVAAHLTRFKVPARVVFQSSLPKNCNGKIVKRQIREKLAAFLMEQS